MLSKSVPAGKIVSQTPKPGTKLAQNAKVEVVISLGHRKAKK